MTSTLHGQLFLHGFATDDMAECETCAFIVKKKKRRCRLQPVKGSIYCAEHLNIDESVCNDLHRSSHLHLEVSCVAGTWPSTENFS